jgi:hypothetical protein
MTTKNENTNENNNQELAVLDNGQQALAEFSADLGFAPKTIEEFNLIRELLDTAAALDGLEFPKLKSSELAKTGDVFDLIDAVQSTINTKVKTADGEISIPKSVITFVIELNNEIFAVMKDGNSINLQYAEFFSKFKAIGKPQRRNGFQFVEATWLPKVSGNHPVILKKAQVEKQISAKK